MRTKVCVFYFNTFFLNSAHSTNETLTLFIFCISKVTIHLLFKQKIDSVSIFYSASVFLHILMLPTDRRAQQPGEWPQRQIVSISWRVDGTTERNFPLASSLPWRKFPSTKTSSPNCRRRPQNSTSATNSKLWRRRNSPSKKKIKRYVPSHGSM